MTRRFTRNVHLRSLILLVFFGTNSVVVASFLGSHEPLIDWLDRLQIHIPDQSFSAQFLTIQLRNVSCTHFTVAHIDSAYAASADNAPPQIQFTVRQVAASCSGVYLASGGIHGTLSAQLAVEAEEESSNSTNNALEWTLQVLDDAAATLRMPGAIQSLQCTTHLACTGLHFSGPSISAQLLELFRDVIVHAVNHAVRDQICPLLQPKADAVLNAYLQTALKWLRPYLIPPLSPKHNESTKSTVTPAQLLALEVKEDVLVTEARHLLWTDGDDTEEDENRIVDFDTDLPQLMLTLQSVNHFIDTHLHHGFVPSRFNTDNVSCGGLFDGINGVLQLALPDAVTIPTEAWIPTMHFTLPHYAAVELQVHNITVAGAGLAEWRSVQLLRPVLNANGTTFHTQLETPSNVSIAVALTVQVQEVPGGIFHGDALVESFVVHVNVQQFLASMDFSLQLRREVLERMTVGMLAGWRDHDVDCVLQVIQHVEVRQLIGVMVFSEIFVEPIPDAVYNDTYINQQLEYDIDHLIDVVIELVITEYKEMTTAASGGLIRDVSLQNQINQYLAERVIPRNTDQCNHVPSPSDSGENNQTTHLLNFTSFELLHRLNEFLNQSGTLAKLNPYLECTTNVLKNALRHMLVHPNSGHANQSVAQVIDVDIFGAGSVQQLELLLPSSADGLHLESAMIWASADSEVRPHALLSLNVDYIPLNISAIVNVTIVLDDIHIGGGTVFPFDEGQFRQMSILKLLSSTQCAMVPIEKADFHIYETESKLGVFEILVNASLTLLEQNDTFDFAFHSNDFPDVLSYASSVFEWSVSTGMDMMEAFAKVLLTVNSDQCNGESTDKHATWSDPNALPMKPLFLILFSVFLFLQPAVLFIKRARGGTIDSRLDENTGGRDESMEPLLHPRYRSDELIEEQNTIHRAVEPSCFMLDSSIPGFARYLILLSIVMTVILLFVSNISVGASVEMLISDTNSGNALLQLPALFSFGLLNTANDMLKARIYPLFFLVVVFSGIWPYMKLFLMLFAWIGSKSMLGNEKRGELLFKLDALSKFSLVDTYVLIVMLVAFRFHLPLINSSSLDVFVLPQFGFFGFLLATTLSLLIGHVLLFFHRYANISTSIIPVDEEDLLMSDRSPIPARALGSTIFNMNDGSQRGVSKTGHFTLLILLVLVLLLFCVGVTQKCFVFEVGGLAGLALGDGNRSAYSVLSFGAAIPSSTLHPSSICIRLLQIIFYFYTIAMPFVALALLSILWVIPMQRSFQFPLMTLAEVANAWSAIEVFCLSIIAALLQIETFTNFIIGHRCDFINQLLIQYHETGGVDTCYSVAASVSWNGLFLVLGAILNSFLVSLMLRLLHASMLECSLDAQSETLALSDTNSSFIQKVAASRSSAWFLCEIVDDAHSHIVPSTEPTLNAAFAEDEVSELVQYGEASTEEWKEVAEQDPTWREWKEATNVT